MFGNVLRKFVKSFSTLSEVKINQEQRYQIQRATTADFVPICALLWQNFLSDSSTLQLLGFGKTYGDIFKKKVLEKGYSVVVRCTQTGKIVGAAVNDVIHESNKNSIVKFARSTIGEKQPELKMYLAKVGDFSHFYKKLNVKQMFEIQNIIISKDHKNTGLEKILIEESENIGLEEGIDVLKVNACDKETSQICLKNRMRKIATVTPHPQEWGRHSFIFDESRDDWNFKIYISKKFHVVKYIEMVYKRKDYYG